MKCFQEFIEMRTGGELQFINITNEVKRIVDRSGVKRGLVNVFAPHATGVIIINEDEKNLREDIKSVLDELVSKTKSYKHPFNAHSHLRSILLGFSHSIPVVNGKLSLGTWQEILWVEVDPPPRRRKIIVTVLGE